MFYYLEKSKDEINIEIKLNDQLYDSLLNKKNVRFVKDDDKNFIYHISNYQDHKFQTKKSSLKKKIASSERSQHDLSKKNELELINSLNLFMLYLFIIFIITVNICCFFIFPYFIKTHLKLEI